MTTRLLLCATAMLFCIAGFGDEPNKAVQAEHRLLEGEWRIVSVELDGKSMGSKTIVKFTGGTCTITAPGIPAIGTTITLDPTKKPKRMDVTNDKGKTQKGIYEVNGDKMRAVFQIDEKGEHPMEFKAKKGEVMYTYERVKPK